MHILGPLAQLILVTQSSCFPVPLQVPALQRFMRSRAHIHQQTGVQITSSTIYTSLHIARVNVRDPGTINDGLGAAREADALLVQDESTRNQQGQQNGISEPAANNALQYQEQSPQQAGSTPAGSGSLNPFGSLLLWLLGGGASDGIVSSLCSEMSVITVVKCSV